MTLVSELVSHLDARLPFAWAEEWDRVGLLAGEPDGEVTRVLVSLDPTPSAIVRAQAMGASVLLTHHPAFLDPLDEVVAGPGAAGAVFEAIRRGVALVACHTNLDRAPEGADALPEALGLEVIGPLELPRDAGDAPAGGRVCAVPSGATLALVARAAGEALGVRPRVWGEPERPIATLGVASGSAGSLVDAALAAGCDALFAGEVRYHGALAALEAGLAVIEAGHDATEWPLTRALAHIAAETIGLGPDDVVLDEVACPWWIG